MTISFVSYSTNNAAANSSLAVSVPTGISSGDLLLAVVNRYSSTETPSSVPSGWTLIGSNTSGLLSIWGYYRIATGSEPSDYTWGWTTSTRIKISIAAYTGDINSSDLIDSYAFNSYDTAAFTIVSPGITVTETNSDLIFFGSAFSNNASFTSTGPFYPGTFTVDVNCTSSYSSVSDIGHHFANYNWSSNGSTGSFGCSIGTSLTYKSSLLIALNPVTSINYSIDSNTGSFSSSGANLTFVKGRNLAVSETAFTYSGSELPFIKALSFNSETGTFIYGGANIAVGTFKTYELDITNNPYVYSGTDLLFSRSWNLNITNSPFSYSGYNLTLQATLSYSLDIESGVFSYSGGNVPLLRNDLSNFFIGGDNTNNFTGRISKVRFYNSALQERDHYLYKNGFDSILNTASLILNSSPLCDKISGIRDKTLNLNNITKGNSSNTDTYPTYNENGRFYFFDGSDDYISGFPNLTGDFLISICKAAYIGSDIQRAIVEQSTNTDILNDYITSGQFKGNLYNLTIIPFALTELEKEYLKYKQYYYVTDFSQKGLELHFNKSGLATLSHYYENDSNPYEDFSNSELEVVDTLVTNDNGLLFESSNSNLEIVDPSPIVSEDVTISVKADFSSVTSECYILQNNDNFYLTVGFDGTNYNLNFNGSVFDSEKTSDMTHLVVVAKNNKTPKFYINGEFVGEGDTEVSLFE